mmetsp:Transcript_94990/g.163972  ORF Transcript_94990/g.163972 Transcript_94990/m.163972 type:complete len:276 (-) Transcript_94990:1054-1881(-)
MMSTGHWHRGDCQNTGNVLGNRSCVRQSKYFRQYESGNNVKHLLGQDSLVWDTNKKQGVYSGVPVYNGDTHRLTSVGDSLKLPTLNPSKRGTVVQQLNDEGGAGYQPRFEDGGVNAVLGSAGKRFDAAATSRSAYTQPHEHELMEQVPAAGVSRQPQGSVLPSVSTNVTAATEVAWTYLPKVQLPDWVPYINTGGKRVIPGERPAPVPTAHLPKAPAPNPRRPGKLKPKPEPSAPTEALAKKSRMFGAVCGTPSPKGCGYRGPSQAPSAVSHNLW